MGWEAVVVFEIEDRQKAIYHFFFFPKEQKCSQAEEDTTFASLNLLAILSPDPPLN